MVAINSASFLVWHWALGLWFCSSSLLSVFHLAKTACERAITFFLAVVSVVIVLLIDLMCVTK